MSDPVEEKCSESFMDKIQDKIQETVHHYRESSSSDSDSEKHTATKKFRLFGRKNPVHTVFGGGKSADIILWRNRQITAGIVAGTTVVWFIFEGLGYHLLTFICHALIVSLLLLFCWSKVAGVINVSPPKLPEVVIPVDLFVSIALSARHEFERAFATVREIASGKDLKKFLMVMVGLWIVSVISSWFSFLTLCYLVFVMLHTVPVLYEKNKDQVDTFAKRAMVEINKQYKVLDAKVIQKLPKLPLKSKQF